MVTDGDARSRRFARIGGAIIIAAGFILGLSYYPLVDHRDVPAAVHSSDASDVRVLDGQSGSTEQNSSLAQSRRLAALQVGVVSIAFLLLYVIILKLLRERDRMVEDHEAETQILQDQAAAAEASSRAKSEFLANMSRELRGPLKTILSFTETMRRERFGPIGTVKYKHYLDDMLTSGRHLLCIVDDVLDLSRVDAGKVHLELEQIPLQEIIEDCRCVVENPELDSGPEVLTRIDDPGLLLFVDGRRMKQVLRNVLANAKSFTPPTGRIEIKARRSADGGVEILVSDTGIGMAAEDVETALKPFGDSEQPLPTPVGGANLGLPLASALVQMHGGHLDIASRLGRGTRVSVTLPRHCIADPSVPRLRLHAA